MDIPKPHDPRLDEYKVDKNEVEKVEVKREFIRTAHLMQKPFRSSDLVALRKALEGGKR